MVRNRNSHNTIVNIDDLSMESLLELNKKIVNRLKELNLQKQAEVASRFRIGDIVSFVKSDDKVKVIGFITSIRKTKISLLTEMGSQWTASLALLRAEGKPSRKLLKLLDSVIPKPLHLKVSTRK